MSADARALAHAVATYRRANAYINEGLIRVGADGRPSGRTRRRWMEWFLPLVGDPQRAFAAVHVGGTSGKGSVCAMVAEVLRAAGVRCGLHVSPYVQLATEKLWIDGRYASADAYGALVEWLRPLVEPRRGPEVPMHGIASVALFLEHFRRQQVELGVVEVGVGGRSDLTNVLRTRVAAITNVGLDHLRTLGPTLEAIAWHKAGIIRRGCRAVVHARTPRDPARLAAERRARAVGATLRLVTPAHYRHLADGRTGGARVALRGERWQLDDVELAMSGAFQAANAALALAICEELDPRGERIDGETLRRGLARARLPARLELIPAGLTGGCPLLLDGAHNADKLTALLDTLPRARRLHLVLGVLQSKSKRLLGALAPLVARADAVTATEPRVYAKSARPAGELAAELAALPGAPTVSAEPDALRATTAAVEGAADDDLVLVAGSLYLAGQVRGLFYPDAEVLLRRRSWWR